MLAFRTPFRSAVSDTFLYLKKLRRSVNLYPWCTRSCERELYRRRMLQAALNQQRQCRSRYSPRRPRFRQGKDGGAGRNACWGPSPLPYLTHEEHFCLATILTANARSSLQNLSLSEKQDPGYINRPEYYTEPLFAALKDAISQQ